MEKRQNGMTSQLEKRTFLILLLSTSLAFAWVLNPFFSPIFWAIVLALIFYPLHRKINRKLGNHRNISSLLTLGVCIFSTVLPVIAVFAVMVRELKSIYDTFSENGKTIDTYINSFLENVPFVSRFLHSLGIDKQGINKGIEDLTTRIGEFVSVYTIPFGQNTLLFFINFGLMLYLAFFLFRDGKKIVRRLLVALPLNIERERLLVTKFYEMVHATIKGNIIVAIVQGSLGGVFFWLIGIANPLLWTIAMILTSLIPAIGCGIVWGPVAIYFLFSGELVTGLSLFVYGILVISLVDNFLRPALVGRQTRLPDYVVLFSTIGGLALFGVDGFVIGPLVASLFIVLWQIFIHEFDTNPGDDRDIEKPQSTLHERNESKNLV